MWVYHDAGTCTSVLTREITEDFLQIRLCLGFYVKVGKGHCFLKQFSQACSLALFKSIRICSIQSSFRHNRSNGFKRLQHTTTLTLTMGVVILCLSEIMDTIN